MFITERLTPTEMLVQILSGVRMEPSETSRFKIYRHDRDLCPAFESRIRAMLDVYSAYRTDVHDIQSMRDDGIDILLTFSTDDASSRIGIQIKSEDEFDQWKNGKLPLIEKLKAQYAAAIQNAKVDLFIIAPCVDSVAHRKRLRYLNSEFKNFNAVKILHPDECLGFVESDELSITIKTTRSLCRDDGLLRQARSDIYNERSFISYILVSIVCHTFNVSTDITADFFSDRFQEWSEMTVNSCADQNYEIERAVSWLIGSQIIDYGDIGFQVSIASLPASVCALFFDAKARDMVSSDGMLEYLTKLLDIVD